MKREEELTVSVKALYADAAKSAIKKFRAKVGGRYYPGYHEDMISVVTKAILSIAEPKPEATEGGAHGTALSETIAKILWERFSPEHEVDWPSPHAAEYRGASRDIIASITVTEAMIKAACDAVILGEDENYQPFHLEPREAREAIEAAFAALTAKQTDGRDGE